MKLFWTLKILGGSIHLSDINIGFRFMQYIFKHVYSRKT